MLDEASDVFESLYGYLKTTYSVIDQAGPDINVSENFEVRFTVKNESPLPNILFLSPKIKIWGTQYAHPVDGVVVEELGPVLLPGQSRQVDVKMVADADIIGFFDIFFVEPVANISVTATVDGKRLFDVTNRSRAHIEIAP